MVQAQCGLWQILARQGQIPTADQNHSWQGLLHPFASISSSSALYDATRTSLAELMRAATTGETKALENADELSAWRGTFDEFVAMPLCFLGWPAVARVWPPWVIFIAGFLLFRLFDIAKPFGIRKLEDLPCAL